VQHESDEMDCSFQGTFGRARQFAWNEFDSMFISVPVYCTVTIGFLPVGAIKDLLPYLEHT